MSRLEYRQKKIQEKRKQTPWRQFVKEICSWRPMSFYKTQEGISKYPNHNGRTLNLVDSTNYQNQYPDGTRTNSNTDVNIIRSFFKKLNKLFCETPQPVVSIYGSMNENSQWADAIRNGARNTYLGIAVGDSAENVLYSYKAETNVSNIFNSCNITRNCSNVYTSKSIRESRNTYYSRYIYNSSDIWFSSNLIGCYECIGCNNLQNKSFYINNQQYDKSSYYQKKEKILKYKNHYLNYTKACKKGGGVNLSEHCTGEGIYKCEQVVNGYEISRIKNSRNVMYTDGGNDSSELYDCLDVAVDATHHLYGVFGQGFGEHVYCSSQIMESSQIYYSYYIENCSYCLGCIGLKNKSFCIFNKKYEKEERFEKVDEIFSQLEKEGTLGDFFPGRMNPFYFNDTAAYLIDDSFTKEEVEAEGYLWRDEEIKVDIPEWMEMVKVNELDEYEGWMVDDKFNPLSRFDAGSLQHSESEAQRHIDPSILKKVIQNEEGNVYRVIKMEYDFLVKHGLPLSRKHWLERLKGHFKIDKSLGTNGSSDE